MKPGSRFTKQLLSAKITSCFNSLREFLSSCLKPATETTKPKLRVNHVAGFRQEA